MLNLGGLANFILGSLKDENSGRVALYHYIKNFCRAEDTLNVANLNRFYAECLQVQYWQEKKSELHQDILDLLGRYFHNQQTAFSLDSLWDLPRMQILNLTQIENLYQTVKIHEQAMVKEAETLRIIPEGETRVIALKRTAQGAMEVRTYNNLVRIFGNQLVPVSHDQELFYNEVLELRPHVVQRLRPSPHLQIRFESNGQNTIAQTITGAQFRQSQLNHFRQITEFPQLFFHLKKLEKFYVFRGSDPYYVELMSTLDKAIELLKRGEPDARVFARNIFESAQIAFDQVFPDDKAVYLKLKELAKYLTVQKEEVPYETNKGRLPSPTP